MVISIIFALRVLVERQMASSGSIGDSISHTGSLGTRKIDDLKLRLFNQLLPRTSDIKFLGITFDEKLTFNKHYENIRLKCIQRMNIIKILSNKYWGIKENILKQIYSSLIRSVIEYASPIFSLINKTFYKRIRAIQNNCLRVIYKLPFDTSTDAIINVSNMQQLNTRLHTLSLAYFRRAIINENKFISGLCSDFIFNNKKEIKYKTLICSHKDEIKILLV